MRVRMPALPSSNHCRAADPVALVRQIHARLVDQATDLLDAWAEHASFDVYMGVIGLEEAERNVLEAMTPLAEPGALAAGHVTPRARELAQEAFAATLALGQQLRAALAHGLPQPSRVDAMLATVGALLDVLAPFVTWTDIAMRRVLLEGDTIEAAAHAVGRGTR